MLLPSTSSPFFRTFTADLKRLAVCTNFAAARAWRPSRLRIASSRSITAFRSAPEDAERTSPLPAVPLAPRPLVGEEIRGDVDRPLPAVAREWAISATDVRALLQGGALQDHREVDARHDLDAVRAPGTRASGSSACRRTCRSGSPRPPRRPPPASPFAMRARASSPVSFHSSATATIRACRAGS